MLVETLIGGSAVAGALGGYAVGYAPMIKPRIKRYRVRSDRLEFFRHVNLTGLRVVALADLHACRLWMTRARIGAIVEQANALKPDLVVLLGDYVSGMERLGRWTDLPMTDWSEALSGLSAPLGTFAVLGNHDCWRGGADVRRHLEEAGIAVLQNMAVKLRTTAGARFWLAGLGSQRAEKLGRKRFRGEDDLAGTLTHVRGDTEPVVLLAHEPDVFPEIPDRIDVMLSGHTHGGQVRFPYLGPPYVPSRHGRRYAYGHFTERSRHLIVSGGLGCSGLPLRFGMPPEIVVVEVG
ncbi:metallophosphoesterase [Nitratireductor sp. XY-223]|uniref:metallophosphoesterase n=1 Tax=Nitratireductor sp. XY-223 TaxID=2561926 RepID=UPI0010AAA7CB|nr:metallophosphoesterase [Nitratireductor sp. XY-223]